MAVHVRQRPPDRPDLSPLKLPTPATMQAPEDVLDLFREGRLTTGQAFSLLHTNTIRTAGSNKSESAASGREGGQAQAASDAEQDRLHRLDVVMQELNALIGLGSVKELVLEMQAFVEIQRRRSEQRLATDKTAMHMVFRGNPGTGKTTVARVLGRMFKELNALPKGHLIECERADLVGEYIGHTAQRTRERIRKALGGILFVDEAYALARGGDKDFGKEAIDTLVKSMEDHKDEFIVILAGYRDEMDWFLTSNPGLRSRFPVQIDFPDYTSGELMAIAEFMCSQRQYHLSAGARRRLAGSLERSPRTPYDGNARYVRNVLERAMRRQALRLVRRRRLTREELMTLEASDVWDACDAPAAGQASGRAAAPWTEAQQALAQLTRALQADGETELSAG